MKIFIWIMATVLGIIVILLGLIYFLPEYDMYVVRSDSMKPAFSSGDMVVTASPGSPLGGDIKPGSVVTYDAGGNRITHRVVFISNDYLVTKGDSNKDPDPSPVELSSIRGIYLMKIPFVGYLNVFVRTKMGWFLLIILPAFLLISLIAKEIIKEALNTSRCGKSDTGMEKSINQYEKE